MAPPTELIDYKEVTEIYRKESKSPDVSEVRKDLYPAYRDYVEKLRKESEEEIRKDPYSFKATSMGNEFKKVTQKGSQIFHLRMKKVLTMAARASSGGRVDLSRLTAEEALLFDQVQNSIIDAKNYAMEGKVPETKVSSGGSVCSTVDDRHMDQAMGVINGKREEVAEACPAPASQKVMIRVLEDLPTISGIERPYDLRRNDVVNLPAPIGCALVKRGKAEEIVPFWRRDA